MLKRNWKPIKRAVNEEVGLDGVVCLSLGLTGRCRNVYRIRIIAAVCLRFLFLALKSRVVFIHDNMYT